MKNESNSTLSSEVEIETEELKRIVKISDKDGYLYPLTLKLLKERELHDKESTEIVYPDLP